MAPHTFVFSSDSKTLSIVKQILDELSVPFDHAAEPSVLIGLLADASPQTLIVDCDDIESATRIFHALRSTPSHKDTTTVAIVDGKAGVPVAFRLGATQVMSKPLSMEQARQTLRAVFAMQRRETSASPRVQAASRSDATSTKILESANQATTCSFTTSSTDMATALSTVTLPVPMLPATPSDVNVVRRTEARTTHHAAASSAAAAAPALAPETSGQPQASEANRVSDSKTPAIQAAALELKTKIDGITVPDQLSSPAFDETEIEEISPELLASMEARSHISLVALVLIMAVAGGAAAAYNFVPSFHKAFDGQYARFFGHSARVESAPVVSAPVVAAAAPAKAAEPPQPKAEFEAAGASVQPVNYTGPEKDIDPSQLPIVPEEMADAHVAHQVEAWYPAKARQAHIQGTVILDVIVSANGSVHSADVVSGPQQLALASEEAVKQWKYRRYLIDGQPTAFKTQASVAFPAATAEGQ